MITRDKSQFQSAPTPRQLAGALRQHRGETMTALTRMRAYYDGRHEILRRQRTSGACNNRLVVNHAKYIVDLASAYLIGSPVGYSGENAAGLSALTGAYRRCDVDSVDAELARHAAIYGKGVELCYMDAAGRPRTAALDPRQAFVVYDDSVAHAPLYGVHSVRRGDDRGQPAGYALTVYTADRILTYTLGAGGELPEQTGERPHFFGGVPLVEYWNNEDERGDFAPVLGLIDAYNLLQSDRVNDKEQLVDALLVIMGASLGESDAEFAQAAEKLRAEKIFELPADNADAKYLTKQLTEGDVQVLADALSADIHKIAMVPALTDQDFSGNASGVALRYKLLGLEQLTKGKERWFREGLRSRMRLFAHVLAARGEAALDAENVTMTFSRGLPVNDLEQAQMVSLLRGLVDDEVLLKQLSFMGEGSPENRRFFGEEETPRSGRLPDPSKGAGTGAKPGDCVSN